MVLLGESVPFSCVHTSCVVVIIELRASLCRGHIDMPTLNSCNSQSSCLWHLSDIIASETSSFGSTSDSAVSHSGVVTKTPSLGDDELDQDSTGHGQGQVQGQFPFPSYRKDGMCVHTVTMVLHTPSTAKL